MPRTSRSSTSEQIGQMSTPLEIPQTRSRAGTRNAEPEHTTSNPHYVPSGSERMTDQFFATYGWRERSTTLSQFEFSSRAFWERQGLESKAWDMVEMTEKRNLLNNELNHFEKKIDHKEWGNMTLFFTRAMEGAYSSSKWVDKLKVKMQEKASKQYAVYNRPSGAQDSNDESAESESDGGTTQTNSPDSAASSRLSAAQDSDDESAESESGNDNGTAQTRSPDSAVQAPTTTTTSRSDQLQRSAGDLEDLSQLQNGEWLLI